MTRNRIYERALAECRRNQVEPPLFDWKDSLIFVGAIVIACAFCVLTGTAIMFWWGPQSLPPPTFIHEQEHAR